MKILRYSILCIFIFDSGFFLKLDANRNPRQRRREHKEILNVDCNAEVQKNIEDFKNEGNIVKKISAMRSLMMKRRMYKFNSTTQNMFGNELQSVFNKFDKDDFRQGRMLKSLLQVATRSPLLSPNQQEYVKSNLLSEINKSTCFSEKNKKLSMLKSLENKRDFDLRNRMLINFARHNVVKSVEGEVQELFLKILKETYSSRPLNDERQLNELKKTIEESFESFDLAEKDKKNIKNDLLPELKKNMQMVKLAPESEVFGGMKDITTAYLKKGSEKDFDIMKNNNIPGPVVIS